MSIEQEIQQLAEQANEPIRSRLFEYLNLRSRLVELTGNQETHEAMVLDVWSIQDETTRREAARVAKRMRALARITFAQL
jgi:hypothetical protein